MNITEYQKLTHSKQQNKVNKFKAKKTPCQHGHIHDSVKEANRCNELHLLLKANLIKNLRIQIPFVVVSAHQYSEMKDEQAVEYKADFVYYDIQKQKTVIEDVKGFRTKDYLIKRKLMKEKYCSGTDTIFIES